MSKSDRRVPSYNDTAYHQNSEAKAPKQSHGVTLDVIDVPGASGILAFEGEGKGASIYVDESDVVTVGIDERE